jgi:hypothetical protein
VSLSVTYNVVAKIAVQYRSHTAGYALLTFTSSCCGNPSDCFDVQAKTNTRHQVMRELREENRKKLQQTVAAIMSLAQQGNLAGAGEGGVITTGIASSHLHAVQHAG